MADTFHSSGIVKVSGSKVAALSCSTWVALGVEISQKSTLKLMNTMYLRRGTSSGIKLQLNKAGQANTKNANVVHVVHNTFIVVSELTSNSELNLKRK